MDDESGSFAEVHATIGASLRACVGLSIYAIIASKKTKGTEQILEKSSGSTQPHMNTHEHTRTMTVPVLALKMLSARNW
jgi:hypothetical protein